MSNNPTTRRHPRYQDRDIYALVAELAGGFKDDERILEDVIHALISDS